MIKSKIMIIMVLVVMASLFLGATLVRAEDASGVTDAVLIVEPQEAINTEIGEPHSITATYLINGAPAAGIAITFTIVEGPNAGCVAPATIVTDAAGQATFTYSYCADPVVAGTDVILVDPTCVLEDIATKQWIPPVQPPPVVPSVTTWGLLAAAVMMGLLIPLALRRRALSEA